MKDEYDQLAAEDSKHKNTVKHTVTEFPLRARPKPFWTRNRLLGLGLFSACIIVAITVSLAAVFVRRAAESTNTQSPTYTPVANGTTVWQPRVGATWNYQIDGPLPANHTGDYDVWDIDLFENNINTISALQQQGSQVICYFSAGSYEEWRPDAVNFTEADRGKNLSGWPGEAWINVSSPNVRNIMLARLDMAVAKSCNGVDPDNMDGYNNDNGLNLTKQDAINYMNFLAQAAHQRGLSIGLKNAGEIVPSVVNVVQWSVNEACVVYDECTTFDPFIQLKKPVFHVEYPKGSDVNNDDSISSTKKKDVCDAPGSSHFSTIIKNSNLDAWIEVC